MRLSDDAVLFWTPCVLLDRRVQMVVPTFAALFTNAALEMRGDQ